jgi:hypothetical protein
VSGGLDRSCEFECWENVDREEVRMSDHPGVVVRLSVNRTWFAR